MNLMVTGRFDEAKLNSLFVDNTKPSFKDIHTARQSLPALSEAISEILAEHPAERGYAKEQRAYRPILYTMEQAGWTLAGSGYFSMVFFRAGLALKVGLKPRDSGLMYAAWCRANQGRAGVPVLYYIAALYNMYTVLMDRCEAVVAGELNKHSALYDPRITCEFDAVKSVINLGHDGWVHDSMELCRTAADIRDFFTGVARFDMHSGNVMLDRDGNLVITDPVSFVGTDTNGDDETDGYTYTYSTEDNNGYGHA